MKTFHKRELPESLIALSSPEGKKLFREALNLDGMEGYFPLAEQFVTQSEPAFCSLSSLAMVMNALNIDPKRVWKGAWRWVSEDTLQSGTSQRIDRHLHDRIRKSGMGFGEFEALARSQGVRIASHRVAGRDLEEQCLQGIHRFRHLVQTISSSNQAKSFLVVNFARQILHQTGDGHFSPIGGYHPKKDLVLLMDVARFKYPPYWLPLRDLWAAMAEPDAKTGQPRGYFVVSCWEKDREERKEQQQPRLQEQQQSQQQESSPRIIAKSTITDTPCTTMPVRVSYTTRKGTITTSPASTGAGTGTGSAISNTENGATSSAISSQAVHINQECPTVIRAWQEFKKYDPQEHENTECCMRTQNQHQQQQRIACHGI
eukprot:CAMPEP_0174978244 /NCGR_PEP_ID=MMETSP0004_2-20121128/14080_1 /TAXON_ID=420556 /ORGANISM="Ochromonas sp., Strain CCMP1393" /LENGTH=372 /DNA_ID=CAMNT_0016229563 /DNA_START=227 /DNA_END=1345 /DNA_ORIENTATION=+